MDVVFFVVFVELGETVTELFLVLVVRVNIYLKELVVLRPLQQFLHKLIISVFSGLELLYNGGVDFYLIATGVRLPFNSVHLRK